jgi:hypothetical protein
VLRDAESEIGGNGGCAEARSDWASGLRGCLIWGIPAVALSASPQRYLAIAWPVLLTFMGAACILNARRCGRVHCYFTGPFFLLVAVLSLLYGVGVLPLGAHGWFTLSALLVIGSAVLICVPEWLIGRYRSSEPRSQPSRASVFSRPQ